MYMYTDVYKCVCVCWIAVSTTVNSCFTTGGHQLWRLGHVDSMLHAKIETRACW